MSITKKIELEIGKINNFVKSYAHPHYHYTLVYEKGSVKNGISFKVFLDYPDNTIEIFRAKTSHDILMKLEGYYEGLAKNTRTFRQR